MVFVAGSTEALPCASACAPTIQPTACDPFSSTSESEYHIASKPIWL